MRSFNIDEIDTWSDHEINHNVFENFDTTHTCHG